MGETAMLHRAGSLAGRRMASVTPLAPAIRFSLRGEASALAVLADAFGVAPGQDACRAVSLGDRAALWLGPDEWMLLAPGADGAELYARCEQVLQSVPHSLVDVSHRGAGFVVAGEGAATLLAEGCPLDLDLPACPVGMSTRTVLGKCEVVLWRLTSDSFRVECWRSFAPYLAAYLAQAAENI